MMGKLMQSCQPWSKTFLAITIYIIFDCIRTIFSVLFRAICMFYRQYMSHRGSCASPNTVFLPSPAIYKATDNLFSIFSIRIFFVTLAHNIVIVFEL